MKTPRFWLAVLVAAVFMNVADVFVQGGLFTQSYYSKIDALRTDGKPMYFIIGDLAAVFVLALVMNRVSAAFESGWKGGVKAGLWFGLIVNFPTWHFIFLMTKGYPYELAWINTLYGIALYAVTGAIIGAIARKAPAA